MAVSLRSIPALDYGALMPRWGRVHVIGSLTPVCRSCRQGDENPGAAVRNATIGESQPTPAYPHQQVGESNARTLGEHARCLTSKIILADRVVRWPICALAADHNAI